MTLTRRLTMIILGWIVIILAVFNVIFLARIQTQAYNTLRDTLRLELSDAWHLNQQVPHLSVTESAWEDAVLIVPSSVQFYDARGRLTSSGWTTGFPESDSQTAIATWLPTIKADMGNYAANHPSPIGSSLHRTIPSPDMGSQIGSTPPESTWLPATDVSAQSSNRFIGIEQPFLYPDGSPGAIVVLATESFVANAVLNALHGLLWTDGPVILIVGLGTYLVTARGLRPINMLIEAIRTVEWSLMSRIYVGRSPLEIQTLANTVNQLLDRVDNGLREQRRFIADASHELRTPLAIIGGHVNVLRRWGSTNEEVWEPAVHHIVGEVGRLQLLVDNLLLLARLDAGDKPEFEPIPCDKLRGMMVQLREDGMLLRPDLHWSSAVHIPSTCSVHMQSHALRQVMVSLIDNATKHTAHGGTVSLSAVADHDEIYISVQDDGSGIPRDDLPFVFERFYRSKTTPSRKKTGSGLGLAIAKELVEAYGGRIGIDSEVGVGTTVTLRLPIQPSQELAVQTTDSLLDQVPSHD